MVGQPAGLEFNMLKPPLDNPLVRKAIVTAWTSRR